MLIELSTVKWGSGDPSLVLLHGLGDGAFVWRHIAPELAKGASVLAIELRGHGDSPHDPGARYEPESYAADVIETMKSQCGSRPITLIGHSLGAAVAIHIAAAVPAQVRTLVLVDGGPGLNVSALRHIHEQFLSQSWLHESVDSFEMELQRRHVLSQPEILRGVAEGALRALPSGGYELKCDRRLIGPEPSPRDDVLREKLKSFQGRVHVIRGAGSAVMSLQSAAQLVSRSPRGQLHTVPMAGHTVMLDNPVGLLKAITTFARENVL